MVEEDELGDITMFRTPFVYEMPYVDEFDTVDVQLEDESCSQRLRNYLCKKLVIPASLNLCNVFLLSIFVYDYF